MKLPSSTDAYLAMIPRRSSLVSCFGSGSESMSSSMIAVVWSLIDATECPRGVVFMWASPELGVVSTSGQQRRYRLTVFRLCDAVNGPFQQGSAQEYRLCQPACGRRGGGDAPPGRPAELGGALRGRRPGAPTNGPFPRADYLRPDKTGSVP